MIPFGLIKTKNLKVLTANQHVTYKILIVVLDSLRTSVGGVSEIASNCQVTTEGSFFHN